MGEEQKKTPIESLTGNIVWFALGMIVVGVTGTIGFLKWLGNEVNERVGDQLRDPETIVGIAENPSFLKPLATFLAENHADDLRGPTGKAGTASVPNDRNVVLNLARGRVCVLADTTSKDCPDSWTNVGSAIFFVQETAESHCPFTHVEENVPSPSGGPVAGSWCKATLCCDYSG